MKKIFSIINNEKLYLNISSYSNNDRLYIGVIVKFEDVKISLKKDELERQLCL